MTLYELISTYNRIDRLVNKVDKEINNYIDLIYYLFFSNRNRTNDEPANIPQSNTNKPVSKPESKPESKPVKPVKPAKPVSEPVVINNTDELREIYQKALNEYIAKLILKISKQYVPVDTGKLKKSAIMEQVNNKSFKITYGSGLDYAPYVHERMDLIHPNGRAKFLEDAAFFVYNMMKVNGEPIFNFRVIIEGNLVILEIDSVEIADLDKLENPIVDAVLKSFTPKRTPDSIVK